MSKNKKNYEIVQPTFQLRVEKNVQSEPKKTRESIVYKYPIANKIKQKAPVYINKEIIGLGESPISFNEQIIYARNLQNEKTTNEKKHRTQQPIVKTDSQINPQDRIDYINKQRENQRATKLQGNLNTNNEFAGREKINKYQKQVSNKNYEEILDLFYPTMSNKSEIDVNKKPIYSNQKLENSYNKEQKIPEISNVEKMFYAQGTFGDKAPKKLYDLTKYKENEKDYEEIASVMYPTMSSNPKINELRERAREEEYQREKELKQTILRYRIGAAITIAAGAIPITRVAILSTTLGKTAVSYLIPVLGKKISELIVPIVAESFLISGISGLGEGLLNNENPIKTALTGILMGTLLGVGIGYGVGVIGKEIAIREIERISNKDELLKKYFSEYVDGIGTRTKEIVEYRRLKAGISGNSVGEVIYDRIGKKEKYKEIWLSKEEYANLISKLNTDLTAEERNKKIIRKCVGNYKYTIINKDFDNYKIIGKKEIK